MMSAHDWVSRISDDVEQHVLATKGKQAPIVCASGISPSGPIHVGNLREVMTVHFVAEELRHWGWQVEHLHFWDDFDRLRKIPAGVALDFQRYLGYPLADAPDPFGEYESYAMRYMAECATSLERLGISVRPIRQSVAYRRGDYVEQIKQAMAYRGDIFDLLAPYQTLTSQEDLEERRKAYYPFRVYCEACHRDLTRIQAYDEKTARIDYFCTACQHRGAFHLAEKVEGKLAWKVDWPMRCSVEAIDFEPAGEDHATPGSSYTVAERIVHTIYQARAPYFVGYAFVGMGGRSKISSSAGTTATIASALEILEPSILRWLYARRSPEQAFEIEYGQGVLRLYDEWDALVKQIQEGKASVVFARAYERATRTSAGPLAASGSVLPFRVLVSIIDLTQANREQVLRIAGQHTPSGLVGAALQQALEPRLSCAMNWVTHYLPDDERTPILDACDSATYVQLSDENRAGIQLLVERMDHSWSLEALTRLIYTIPKLVYGIPPETPPNQEIKAAQRTFFVSLYRLLCGRETGPRIPTLLLSLGRERVRQLLVP